MKHDDQGCLQIVANIAIRKKVARELVFFVWQNVGSNTLHTTELAHFESPL